MLFKEKFEKEIEQFRCDVKNAIVNSRTKKKISRKSPCFLANSMPQTNYFSITTYDENEEKLGFAVILDPNITIDKTFDGMCESFDKAIKEKNLDVSKLFDIKLDFDFHSYELVD